MPAPTDATSLRRLVWLAVAAQLLLVLAGLRHHLVWGESERWPWLLPLLNAGEAACVVGFAALSGIAWWRGMRLVDGAGLSPRRLVLLSLPILFAAVLVPPFLSMDPIDYVVRGRVMALHGGNPYVQVATDFPGDPLLVYGDQAWKSFPNPYGPIVANVQAGVAWLAHRFGFLPSLGELIVGITLFKLLFPGCLVATALLARGVAARLLPGSEDRALLAILWNPVLVSEGVANAHNEPLLVLATMGAVAAAVAGRAGTAAFALALAVGSKFVRVLLGPVFVVHPVRQRRTAALAAGVAASGALALLFWWQFFRDEGSLDFLRRQTAQNSPSVVWLVQHLFAIDDVGRGLWPARGIAVLVALVAAVQVWRRPGARPFVVAAGVTMLVLMLLGFSQHGPWYHLWWLPLALVLGRGYVFRVACHVSVLAPLAHVGWAYTRAYEAPWHWLGLAGWLFVPLPAAVRWPAARPGVSPPAADPS